MNDCKERRAMNNDQKTLEDLSLEQKMLEREITDARARLSNAPEGSLRIAKRSGSSQYYHITSSSPPAGSYIPVKDTPLAQALAQKRYDELFIKAAMKQLSVIERFLKHYDPDALKNMYSSLSEPRKALVTPAVLPDKEFAEAWLAAPFTPKPFKEGDPEHYSSSGLRVRSKSEALIHDTMGRTNVLNKYECPVKLGGEILHPDFTILRMSDRQIIFWEHLGRMDDYRYAEKALYRIRLFEKNKIFPGERLILTMETRDQPLNTAIIKMFIKHYGLASKL